LCEMADGPLIGGMFSFATTFSPSHSYFWTLHLQFQYTFSLAPGTRPLMVLSLSNHPPKHQHVLPIIAVIACLAITVLADSVPHPKHPPFLANPPKQTLTVRTTLTRTGCCRHCTRYSTLMGLIQRARVAWRRRLLTHSSCRF
jgi:hypothetical protein